MNVKKFVKHWSSYGYEKGEAQPFWLSFLRDVFDIAEPQDKERVQRLHGVGSGRLRLQFALQCRQ